jgi:hypothetical protein
MSDRLEFRPRENGEFDEIVARFGDGMVHVETMSGTSCYVGFYWNDGLVCQWYINSARKLTYHHEVSRSVATPPDTQGAGYGELVERLRQYPAGGGKQLGRLADAAATAIQTLTAENERLEAKLATVEPDKARLDFLDECNTRLNAKYGTEYGWRLILNHNVNRLMLGPRMDVDLHDSEGGNKKLRSCRAAIDERLRDRALTELSEPKS